MVTGSIPCEVNGLSEKVYLIGTLICDSHQVSLGGRESLLLSTSMATIACHHTALSAAELIRQGECLTLSMTVNLCICLLVLRAVVVVLSRSHVESRYSQVLVPFPYIYPNIPSPDQSSRDLGVFLSSAHNYLGKWPDVHLSKKKKIFHKVFGLLHSRTVGVRFG